jgi:hypothetical protein
MAYGGLWSADLVIDTAQISEVIIAFIAIDGATDGGCTAPSAGPVVWIGRSRGIPGHGLCG